MDPGYPPEGKRLMSLADVIAQSPECYAKGEINDVFVLQDGLYMWWKYDGYRFVQGNFLGCDCKYMLIMNGVQTEPLDITYCDNT